MPKNIWIGNKTKRKFKKTIRGVVKGLSRKITVYLTDRESECPNCYYDKLNDRSSGVAKVAPSSPTYFTVGRCPVCGGRGVIITSRKKCINANITWNPTQESLNALSFNEAGSTGVTKVQIKTDPCYLELIRDCKKVILDGVSCKLATPPLLRGLGTESILVAIFFTEDTMKVRE